MFQLHDHESFVISLQFFSDGSFLVGRNIVRNVGERAWEMKLDQKWRKIEATAEFKRIEDKEHFRRSIKIIEVN